jgi:Mycobacterium 19 kDa lipoprotein antigen
MRKTPIAVAAMSILAVPMGIAHANQSGSYTATLGGETIGQGTYVKCSEFSSYGADGGPGVKVAVGRGANGDYGVETSFWGTANIGNEGPEVYQVSLNPLTGADSTSPGYVRWAAGPDNDQSQATVVQSDNTYRITGTAAPVYQPGKTPLPFEFEVTCP